MNAKVEFKWIDYFLFIFMLVLSALVGVYYGFIKKQNTAKDYLLGNKQMGVWPIAMSLASSSLSGLAMLAVPADIYRYGISYAFTLVLYPIVLYVGYKVYIPVFYKLQVTSTYEYLGIRFDKKVRIFASVLFTIQMLLFLPIVIYIPALALAHATGINAHLITPIVCSVCIFYTTLGGLKAVVWTDVIQFFAMVGSLLVVLGIGIVACGGFGAIFEKASLGGRLDLSFEFDLLTRDNFWTGTIGNFVMWVNHFDISQSFIQKCISLPTFQAVRSALVIACVGLILIMGPCIFTGLVMFAIYYRCDPLEKKLINTHDQLIPMYVMEIAQNIPGLSGLFISGIFSAALSTLSAAMNCLAATIYEDFISPFVSKTTTQQRVSVYLKLLVVSIGIVSTLCVYIVERLGSLLGLTLAFFGVTSGPLLGIFTAGMLIPMVNEKGALCGGIVSLLTMGWIIMTAQWYTFNKQIVHKILPVFTDHCNDTLTNLNETVISVTGTLESATVEEVAITEQPAAIYRISLWWYCTMGILIVIFVSVVVSWFTKTEKRINKDCISPVVHFLVKKEEEYPPRYDTIENALELVNKH